MAGDCRSLDDGLWAQQCHPKVKNRSLDLSIKTFVRYVEIVGDEGF